jgi:hypothetical protein
VADAERSRVVNRRTRLARRTRLQARTPLKPVSDKRAAAPKARTTARHPETPGEFTPRVKLQIRARAGQGDPQDARCEACARWLGLYRGECQHVIGRGMGGSRDQVINSAANGVLLCGMAALGLGCHGKATAQDPELYDLGFWAKRGDGDPRRLPMRVARPDGTRRRVWRSVDGRYLDEPPQRSEAA